MASEAVKLAKLQDRQELRRQIIALLQHPIYSVLAAFIIIEWLQSQTANGQPLMGKVSGTALETAFITEGVLTSLAKSGALSDIAMIGGVAGKLAPLLLAAGG